MSVIDRITDRCVQDENGCWVWQGSKDRSGYGHVRVDHRTLYTHRVVYEVMVEDIPAGLQLDHLCRNRSCCNPEHLEPVTLAVNASRTLPGQRGQHRAAIERAKTHCPRGHAYDQANTYANAKGYRWCRACRREKYAERSATA